MLCNNNIYRIIIIIYVYVYVYVYVCALPVLLLWETIEKVFGCESGIHINNLKHNAYETS